VATPESKPDSKPDSKLESKIESSIDELYRAPLSAFVEARATLARSLTGDAARRVRKLAKPTIVPWAANQVYWRARPLFDRLLKSGAHLRDAQVASLEGKRADVRAALEAHRQAIAEAVKTAEQIAAADGLHPPADALLRTLETLSLTPATPVKSSPGVRADAPGRLTKPLLPVGFAALSGVKIAAPAEDDREDRQKNVQTDKTDKKKAAEDARRRSAEAVAQKRDKEKVAKVKKAEAALERARRQMAEAQAALKRATDES
jgi:hypothetical protein